VGFSEGLVSAGIKTSKVGTYVSNTDKYAVSEN